MCAKCLDQWLADSKGSVNNCYLFHGLKSLTPPFLEHKFGDMQTMGTKIFLLWGEISLKKWDSVKKNKGGRSREHKKPALLFSSFAWEL